MTVAVGDFDEDGHVDTVAPLLLQDRVAVRLGTGDTRLAENPGDVPVGAKPFGIAVGDFDGDGHEDFAAAGFGGGVSVRLGRGDGTFRDGGEAAAGRSTTALTAGDLNGDGTVDLAAMHGLEHVVGPLIGTSPAPLAGNLLVNGGFEQGLGARLPGQQPAVQAWATEGGMTFARHGAHPHRGFPSWLDAVRWSGGTNLLWGGIAGAAGATAASQVVDVGGSTAAIDGGRATARLSAELGGALAVTDSMTATARSSVRAAPIWAGCRAPRALTSCWAVPAATCSSGGAGRDRLSGGAGPDRLDGGAARDRCLGGPGRDRSRACEGR